MTVSTVCTEFTIHANLLEQLGQQNYFTRSTFWVSILQVQSSAIILKKITDSAVDDVIDFCWGQDRAASCCVKIKYSLMI